MVATAKECLPTETSGAGPSRPAIRRNRQADRAEVSTSNRHVSTTSLEISNMKATQQSTNGAADRRPKAALTRSRRSGVPYARHRRVPVSASVEETSGAGPSKPAELRNFQAAPDLVRISWNHAPQS